MHPAFRWLPAVAAVLFIASSIPAAVMAQGAPPPPPPRSGAPTLNVYLDCQDGGCDFDYLRGEIRLVNWVRDRQVADVHLLVTSQPTGAGGREFTVSFIGLRRFANVNDTLTYVQPPASTEDDRRRGLARVFRMGLIRYVARTPAAERLTITYADEKKEEQAKPTSDRWNFWVFRISANSWMNGEKTYSSTNLFGNFSADRVTAAWKTRLNVNQSYSESQFELNPTTKFVNIQRTHGASVLQVKSLGEHWSAGVRASLSSSTYDNYDRVLRAFPAVEYNIFPYSQSTRRQVRLEYNVGYADFRYRDTTVFDKLAERMPLQRLMVSAESKEPWGSIEAGILGTSYLNDRTKYRLDSYGEISWRLFKGFNVRAQGGYDVIRDQFALAKKNFSPEEILTRQFQQATTYRFWGSAGISYTFGSIFNNVVNPRFAGNFFE